MARGSEGEGKMKDEGNRKFDMARTREGRGKDEGKIKEKYLSWQGRGKEEGRTKER